MRFAQTWGIAVCLLAGGSSMACLAQSPDFPLSPETAKTLAAIEQARRTPADARAARRLNIKGDSAYRKGDYAAAFTAFANSYPNDPNAYAYIMAGDANWRASVQYHQRAAGKSGRDPHACVMDNSHFAADLADDLARHYAVGLALAKREKDKSFLRSNVYRRARESASCLDALAREYQAMPPSACVDLTKLRQCLGPPLLGAP